MNLDYGPEYEAWRAKVQEFLAEHAQDAPKGEGLRSEKTLAWQRMLIEQGFVARTIPKEYGGGGEEPDILKSRIVAEEFANARVSPGLNSQGITLLVPVLLEVGSEEQKRKFVGPTLRGEVVWCQGYSEPDAGSDLAALRTSAVLDGDQWVVNGQKIWCSTAHEADWIFCLVRTEPDAPKHKGLSFLLFRMDTPGIEVRPLVDMTGGHWFNEVFFTDVRVPKEQMLGVRSEGWQVARSVLGHERDSMGDPRAAFWRLNALIELMKTETVNGQRLIDHPVYRDRLMKLQGRVMAMWFNDLRILSAKVNHDDARLARMVVKLENTEMRHEMEALAVDAMGELGLAYEDNPYLRNHGTWQHHYMFTLGLIIGGGTSQIQKNIIGENGLGFPREMPYKKPAKRA